MGTIYKIQNNITNDIYIGLTTRPVEVRWNEHRNFLGTNSDSQKNCLIHQALLAYKPINFDFSVVEDNIPDNKLNEREIYWISYYNSYNEGYNMTPGGDTKARKYNIIELKQLWNEGLTLKDIANQKCINKSYLGILLKEAGISQYDILTRSNAYKSCPVEQYKLNGEYITTFRSIREAAIAIGNENKTGNICNACKGKITQTGHFIWRLVGDLTPIDELVERAKNVGHHRNQKVDQFNLNGCYIKTFNTISEAAAACNLKALSSITNVLKGRSKTAGGYMWKYNNEY